MSKTKYGLDKIEIQSCQPVQRRIGDSGGFDFAGYNLCSFSSLQQLRPTARLHSLLKRKHSRECVPMPNSLAES